MKDFKVLLVIQEKVEFLQTRKQEIPVQCFLVEVFDILITFPSHKSSFIKVVYRKYLTDLQAEDQEKLR